MGTIVVHLVIVVHLMTVLFVAQGSRCEGHAKDKHSATLYFKNVNVVGGSCPGINEVHIARLGHRGR
jgi:hypothetical protein